MKKILIILLITLFSSSLFASDEKPGRFFEDQPDVNDDFQIHFIYLLAKNTHEIIHSSKLSDGIDLYEKEFSKRFRKHYLSCALARLILQSPFMTKRLLRVASNDQDTIDFVVELLFDEAYLTLKEVFKIAYKFIIPTKLLVLSSKN